MKQVAVNEISSDGINAARLAYSRAEAAELLGVSLRHLIHEIERKKLRVTASGRRRLISREELLRYLRDQQMA